MLDPVPQEPAEPGPSPAPATLYAWFARSVERFPDAAALELRDVAYSYRTLNQYAERLAERVLRTHGRRPARVALMASRSLVAFAGYLAAQRLGATVVPLDPGNPEARNKALLAQAGADVLIADETAMLRWSTGGADARHPSSGYTVLALTDPDVIADASRVLGTVLWPPVCLPPYQTTEDDVAYVLFTSGAGGRPKGVPVRHRQVSAYLAHCVERYQVGPDCRMSHAFDLAFDPAVFDLFVTWGAGATLVVPQRGELATPVDYLVQQGITHWLSAASLVSVLDGMGNLPTGMVSQLRYSVFLGEPLTYRQARAWRAVAPGSEIENVYGCAELVAGCT
ncbi:MAG: AMP-binding protein, partial [Actinocrinis sp.]